MTTRTTDSDKGYKLNSAAADKCPCPACRAPMTAHRFKRQLHGEIALDICFSCQGIWFDDFESAQLAPAGILELFRLLHEHHDKLRQPWRDDLQCPRCHERLLHGLDRTRNGHFAYHRCPARHGRFNSFSAFMQEKGFVRQLNGDEIATMAREIPVIRCSGCGASVDIRRDNVCGHCRSPIVILDADAIGKALSDFTQQAQRQSHPDPHAVAEALLANERLKSRMSLERRKSVLDTEITDLVIGGVETVWNLIRR